MILGFNILMWSFIIESCFLIAGVTYLLEEKNERLDW